MAGATTGDSDRIRPEERCFRRDSGLRIPTGISGDGTRARCGSIDLRNPRRDGHIRGPERLVDPAALRALDSGANKPSNSHAGTGFHAHALFAAWPRFRILARVRRT